MGTALAAKTAAGRITALEFGTKGSLAGWFSSLVLLAASLVAVVVYTVRRHRMDDYHGVTASGSGPPCAGFSWPPTSRPVCTKDSAI